MQYREKILERFSTVDHHRFLKPLGRPGLDFGKLFFEDLSLKAAIGLVVVVIEAEFAPSHTLGMQGREQHGVPVDRSIAVQRMNAR